MYFQHHYSSVTWSSEIIRQLFFYVYPCLLLHHYLKWIRIHSSLSNQFINPTFIIDSDATPAAEHCIKQYTDDYSLIENIKTLRPSKQPHCSSSNLIYCQDAHQDIYKTEQSLISDILIVTGSITSLFLL